MKKVLLSAVVFASSMLANAQKAPKLETFQDLVKVPTNAGPIESNEKSLGVTIWSDDFSTPANWNVDNNGQTGIDFGWNINNTSDGWWSTNGISSTSAGNYAELVNGDPTASPATQALNVVYTLTTASPIDVAALGGSNQISLQFKQFGARFNDLQEMLISVDGTTWVSVGNNLDKPVLSASGGSAYTNPDSKSINLAPFLTGTPSQLWVRFQWTTNYPASATNPNVWITYGWYIDDVKLVTNPTNDLAITGSDWGSVGLHYFQIPTEQVAPIDFSADIFNGGVNNQSNVKLNVNVNNGLFVGSSAPVSIVSLDTMTVSVATQFTPAATIASYTVTRNISADSTDDVSANNQLSDITFNVTDFIYARDNNVIAGSTSNGTDPFETGNLYDIYQDDLLKAINVRLPNGTNGATVGTEIYTRLYSIDAVSGDFVFESESAPLILAANNLNTNLVIELDPYVNVTAGTTYLAVVGSYSSGLKVSNAGTSPAQTSFFLDGNDITTSTLFYQTSTPYVRLNFDPVLGLDNPEQVQQVVIMPNPSNGVASLQFDLLNASDVAISVLDVSGKEVQTNIMNQLTAGTHEVTLESADWTSGVYFVNLVSNGTVLTKKFVKK
ncbi:MAG: T9SS type A sorting domain-containing protein [Crocinitomicaceae bacterium]